MRIKPNSLKRRGNKAVQSVCKNTPYVQSIREKHPEKLTRSGGFLWVSKCSIMCVKVRQRKSFTHRPFFVLNSMTCDCHTLCFSLRGLNALSMKAVLRVVILEMMTHDDMCGRIISPQMLQINLT